MKTLVTIFVIILLSSLLFSTTRNVPGTYATIQAAINASVNGDVVLVQPGTYVENINYNGKLITIGSLFFTTADTSYISATIIDGNNSGRVVTFNSGEDSLAVLTGFTITNGYASDNGAGILCNFSNPNINNLKITDNISTQYGGGMYCNYSSPNIYNCKFNGNSAQLSGGGICFTNSSSHIMNCQFVGNSAGEGGGICSYDASYHISNCQFVGNSATYGGGMYSGFFSYCQAEIETSSFVNNYSNSGGGGIFFFSNAGNNTIAALKQIAFYNNSSGNSGGGIYSYRSTLDMEYTTLSNNTATGDGSGIYLYISTAILERVTLAGNSTGGDGGGIFCDDSDISIHDSILWFDTPEEIYLNTGSTAAVSYADIQGGWAGTGNITADPLFSNSVNNDCTLLYNSPCIDTGDPASPLDPDRTRADMGAWYFEQKFPVITAINDVPGDQGRQVQLIWNRSCYDQSGMTYILASYSVWRHDEVFYRQGEYEIYDDPEIIFTQAKRTRDKNYYWQRDDEILTFVAQIPAMGFISYAYITPTLKDSSSVANNHTTFQVFAHTDITLTYFASQPDSGYSVDNIAPDRTEVFITKNGNNINLNWEEVEYGTYEGNSYPEINGIWYKVYAGDTPYFDCDEIHLLDTVTSFNYDYVMLGEEKKFYKVVVSDQP